MGEEPFMFLLAGLVVIGLAGYFLLRRLRLPPTAWTRFDSPGVVVEYYRSAVRVLSEHPWLLGLPLCLALADAVTRLVYMVLALRKMASVADAGRPGVSVVFMEAGQGVLRGFTALDLGYYGAFSGSVLLKLAFLPCVVLFWVVCKRLGRHVDDERRPGLEFLGSTLKAALGVLALTLVAMGIIRVLEGPVSGVLSLGLWAVSALWLCALTLIEGVILFWAKSARAGGRFDFRRQLNLSFDILKPLYAFNLLAFLLFSLPHMVFAVVSILPWRELQMKASWLIAGHLGHTGLLYALVVFLTVCAPFVLLRERRGLLGMLKANFQFIGRHLVKYLIFVAIGGLLLSVPSLLTTGVDALAGRLSVPSLLFDLLAMVLRTALGVVFFLALLEFFEERFRTDATA